MSLLELFDKEIYLFFPSDIFAVLNLITTSKTVRNAILDINPKVDVNLANILSIKSFSNIIQKLSKMFTIDKLILTTKSHDISYFDVIFKYCKSISTLSLMYYSDENILVREFIKNMPNCKVLYFYKTLDYNSRIFSSGGILHENIPHKLYLQYVAPEKIILKKIAPEKIILKNIDNIKRLKKLKLNAQRSNNKFNNKS